MKNSSTKKKVIIALSVITVVIALITLVLGAFFVVTAKKTISSQMANYNVNEKTIMWIADLGAPFFGNSTALAIAGIALSLIALLVVAIIWIVAAIKKGMKGGKSSNGTVVAVALTSITAVAAVAGLGVSAVGTTRFKHNTNMDNVSNYFESHAEELSKTPEKASKGGLLYVLANKDDISSFSKASVLQLSLAGDLIFGMAFDPILGAALQTRDVAAEIKELNKDYKFKDGAKEVDFMTWLQAAFGHVSTSSVEHGANMLLNVKQWNGLLNGNYPKMQEAFRKYLSKGKVIDPAVWDKLPLSVKSMLLEMKFTDKNGAILKDGLFNLTTKISKNAAKFEDRVIVTIAKMLALPYVKEDDKMKSRITVLEWLSSTINSIDYISKDKNYEILKGIKSTSFDSKTGVYLDAVVKNPQNIYAGTFKQDGTISLDTKKQVGKVGDSMYDIKLALMKDVLKHLPLDLGKTLKERQKTITPTTFVTHVLEGKGLKELTDQYAAYNSYYDDKNVYGDAGAKKSIQKAVTKLLKFLEK